MILSRSQTVSGGLLHRRRVGLAGAGGAIDVDNPATGEIIGTVPRLGRAETRAAIDAAARAFPAWRRKTAKERAIVLRRWFDLMIANQEDLAQLMTAEQGKPLAESRGEVAYAASFLEWFGEEAKRVYGDTIPGHSPTSGSSSSRNRSAWSPASRPGISRSR